MYKLKHVAYRSSSASWYAANRYIRTCSFGNRFEPAYVSKPGSSSKPGCASEPGCTFEVGRASELKCACNTPKIVGCTVWLRYLQMFCTQENKTSLAFIILFYTYFQFLCHINPSRYFKTLHLKDIRMY